MGMAASFPASRSSMCRLKRGRSTASRHSKSGMPSSSRGVWLRPTEIVVRGERDGAKAVHPQLDHQALAEGGLARGGRPGDQHEPDMFLPGGDDVGQLGDLLLVEALGDLDHLSDFSGETGLVELADVHHAQDPVPGLGLPCRS